MVIGTRLILKRGDTAPRFRAQCLGGEAPAPVDLTGATARLLLRSSARTVRTLPLVVEAGTAGWVNHDWLTGETDIVDVERGEVEVTFSDGSKQTFPADDFITIQIVGDLG